ncbi:hypothetical protein AURDEDRAFT_129846 [Auricularia subglabra TFB-10046 SS5]|nr:hypothetical protein AURDEDRAFT_129846 [Auricularia subglabra TFB-10046 SS5]
MSILTALRRLFWRYKRIFFGRSRMSYYGRSRMSYYARAKYAILGDPPNAYIIYWRWHARHIVQDSPDITLSELRLRILAQYNDFKEKPQVLQQRTIRGYAREVGLTRRQRIAFALDRWLPSDWISTALFPRQRLNARQYYRAKGNFLGRRPSYYTIFVSVHLRRAQAEAPDASFPGLKARVLPRWREFRKLPRGKQRAIILKLARESGLSRRQRLSIALYDLLP